MKETKIKKIDDFLKKIDLINSKFSAKYLNLYLSKIDAYNCDCMILMVGPENGSYSVVNDRYIIITDSVEPYIPFMSGYRGVKNHIKSLANNRNHEFDKSIGNPNIAFYRISSKLSWADFDGLTVDDFIDYSKTHNNCIKSYCKSL